MQKKEGAFLQAPTLPSHFWLLLLVSHFWLPFLPSHFCPPTSALLLQTFSPNIFFFSSRRKEKKTIQKKKNATKERSLLLSSHFALSFLAPTSTFLFFPFYFKHFLLASSYFQAKEKKNKEKTIEKKNMQRNKGAYLQPFVLPSHFWLPLLPSYSVFSFQAFSP